MPLARYGVLKGRPIARRPGSGSSPHYQIQVVDEGGTNYRVAINVRSQQPPSEVMYYVKAFFEHPVTALVEQLSSGFHDLPSQPDSGALDFIRGNLLQPELMTPLPISLPGPDNDLNEKFDQIVQRAMDDERALVYAFGQSWGPENKADAFFGFRPGNGVHDIHMNQGNVGSFTKDDGVWQDGGLLFQFPNQNQWTAVFLKFQSQSWHTDDQTGHTIDVPVPEEPAGLVQVLAAMVNSKETPEKEWVFLLNTSDSAIRLDGWSLVDKQKAKMPLSGTLDAGAVVKVHIQAPVALSNQGGAISVLNHKGLKVHGVSYTREQAKRAGWTVVF